jgi:hypothetical protein
MDEHDNTRLAEPVLCYVDGRCAYFTTQPLKQQWGDDWNDAPYEHNAGDPYAYSAHDEIHRRYYEGWFQTPADDAWHGNSRYSVETINAGGVPWLRLDRNSATREDHIWAGDTIAEFTRKIRATDGIVYAPVT